MCIIYETRRIFAFTRALCLRETLALLDVVSQGFFGNDCLSCNCFCIGMLKIQGYYLCIQAEVWKHSCYVGWRHVPGLVGAGGRWCPPYIMGYCFKHVTRNHLFHYYVFWVSTWVNFFAGLESCSRLTDDSRLRLLVIINRSLSCSKQIFSPSNKAV